MSGTGAGATGAYPLVLVVAAVSIIALTAVLTAVAISLRTKARVEEHIDKLYREIETKADKAAVANYADIPEAFFDLVKALNNKLGPLIELGGPMGEMVAGLRSALNRAPSFTSTKHPTPNEGSSIMVMKNPPEFKTEDYSKLSANADLKLSATKFRTFWLNEKHIKDLIRSTIHTLRGSAF